MWCRCVCSSSRCHRTQPDPPKAPTVERCDRLPAVRPTGCSGASCEQSSTACSPGLLEGAHSETMNTPRPVQFAFVGAVCVVAVRFVVRCVAPFVVRTATLPILMYRYGISPLIGPRCRFYPSCSEYALGALGRFGLLHGLWLSGARLMRCHPWHPGGVDPLPDLFESRGTYIGRAIRSAAQPGVHDTTCPCDPARPVRDARVPSLPRL